MIARMSVQVIGINHKTADIALREQLAIGPDRLRDVLAQLIKLEGVAEVVVVSTCNRTELYMVADDVDLLPWLASTHGILQASLRPHVYQHAGDASVSHAMRVAAGLDSMVLGEPQILGQMKEAFQVACKIGACHTTLATFFEAVFRSAKAVRHQTKIGDNPVSMAYAVAHLSRQIFSDAARCRVMLIGAGETIALVANHLRSQGMTQFLLANRTYGGAKALVAELQATYVPLPDISQHLGDADIIVTATASPLPILGKGAFETALKKRRLKPMLVVDLALPRDVEAEVGWLSDLFLYNLDDLQTLINANLRSREVRAERANALISAHVDDYWRQLRVVGVGDMIGRYREQLYVARDMALSKAFAQLAAGVEVGDVMREMAHSLTNKMLHQPTMALRQAASEDEAHVLESAKKILGIDEQ